MNNSTNSPRKRLTDILGGGGNDFAERWDNTAAADDRPPIPAGRYVARIVSGELFNARTGTPGYKLRFRIIEGEYAGRDAWLDLWLTGAALPYSKRELGKLGVRSRDQLETPIPQGIVAEIRVALRRDDDGIERNEVRRFDVLRVETPRPDPFAPADDRGVEPDTSFDFGANTPPSAEGGAQ